MVQSYTSKAEARSKLRGCGVELPANVIDQRMAETRSMGSYKSSMQLDRQQGRPMEVEAQLMAPLALARAAKIATPTLDVLVPLVAAKAAAKGLYSH